MLLGEYLIEKKHINEEQLNIAIGEQNVTGDLLGEILVRNCFIRRDQLRSALLETRPSALMDDGAGADDLKLPRAFMKKTRTIIKADIGHELFIATLHEDTDYVVSEMKRHVPNRTVCLSPAPLVEILEKLRSDSEWDGQDKVTIVEEEDVNKMMEAVLQQAAKEKATDIHIEPSERTLNIRFRVNTVVSHEFSLSLNKYDRFLARIKDRSGMDVAEKRNPQDGAFSFMFRGITIDCRVATILTSYGEKVAIRLLTKDAVLIDIRDLGITCIDEWLDLANQRNGIILVTGATGSGKSTTLASTLMSAIDRLHKEVYSCEDPVEIRLPYVNQCQINAKSDPPFGYPEFGKSILRLNPDIIVYGELRDEETVKYAMRSAETGHLVYGTVHNNDAFSALSRMMELGATMEQLKTLLRGALVQRLARVMCPHCLGASCDKCRDGYNGVTPVTEFVRFRTPDDVEALAQGKLKYHTFTDDALIKIKAGITDCPEISRISNNKINLCGLGRCVLGKEKCRGRVGHA
jgi:general secretion pathway protein E